MSWRLTLKMMFVLALVQSNISKAGPLDQTAGETYVGEERNHVPHGKGVMTWTDGRRYKGEWKTANTMGTAHTDGRAAKNTKASGETGNGMVKVSIQKQMVQLCPEYGRTEICGISKLYIQMEPKGIGKTVLLSDV